MSAPQVVRLAVLIELIKNDLCIEATKPLDVVKEAVETLGIECAGTLKDKANTVAAELGLDERA